MSKANPIVPLTDPVVSREAREAAAGLLQALFDEHGSEQTFFVSGKEGDAVRAGAFDTSNLVRAFARFEAQIRTQDEGLVELLRGIREDLFKINRTVHGNRVEKLSRIDDLSRAAPDRVNTALSSRGQV